MGLSLRPSTFTAGGSLIDDVDATVIRARFEMFDYGGKSDSVPSPTLMLILKDKEDVEHTQYYSAGDASRFAPSEDNNADLNGINLVPLGDNSAMNGGCNAALLLNSLVQAGFPEDKLDSGDSRVLEGLVGHWNRVPQPKRSNLPKKEGQREAMILICSSIISLPGEAKPKPNAVKSGATATKNTPAAAALGATTVSDDLKDEFTMELVGLFATEGVTSMKKVDVTKKLFGSIDKTNSNKSKLMSMATKDDVLKSLEGFSYNGSVLTQE